MPAKKRTAGAKSKKASGARGGAVPPYGIAINEAVAGGNLRDMKATAARTRKHIAALERALKTLDGAIAKLGG
jgi:hypothetical protein